MTPDTWHLDKATLAVVEERVASKERMTFADGDGAREVAVPCFLRERPSLDAELRDEVAALAQRLEAEKAGPSTWSSHAPASGLLAAVPTVTTRAGDTTTPDVRDTLPEPWSEPGDAERFWQCDTLPFPVQLTMLDHAMAKLVYDDAVNHVARTSDLPFRSPARRFWTHHCDADRPYDQPETDA